MNLIMNFIYEKPFETVQVKLLSDNEKYKYLLNEGRY